MSGGVGPRYTERAIYSSSGQSLGKAESADRVLLEEVGRILGDAFPHAVDVKLVVGLVDRRR